MGSKKKVLLGELSGGLKQGKVIPMKKSGILRGEKAKTRKDSGKQK